MDEEKLTRRFADIDKLLQKQHGEIKELQALTHLLEASLVAIRETLEVRQPHTL